MAIKVLIERLVRPGYEEVVWEMLKDLRSQAIRQRGYMYGETWRSLEDPHLFVVISTWGSREHWERWAKDDFRYKMEARIDQLLEKASTVRIFNEVSTLPGADNSQQ